MDTQDYIGLRRKRLGRLIRLEREKRGWSQGRLAAEIEGVQGQISSYENGGNMDLTTLLKIDRVLALGLFEALEDAGLDAWIPKTAVRAKHEVERG